MKIFTAYLYVSFIIYLISFRLPPLASLHALVTLLVLIWLGYSNKSTYLSRYDLVICYIIMLNIVLIPVVGVSWRELSFLIQFGLTILLFRRITLSHSAFIGFINITYVITFDPI